MDDINSCIRDQADPLQINECRNKLSTNEDSFLQLSAILALVGNDVRLKMLYLMDQEKELCPCDLSDILGISIPAVSQHLRKMKDGNLIESRKEKQTIFYSLKSEHIMLLQPFFNLVNCNTLIP